MRPFSFWPEGRLADGQGLLFSCASSLPGIFSRTASAISTMRETCHRLGIDADTLGEFLPLIFADIPQAVFISDFH